MKVLIACEESQEVCKAFRELGHVSQEQVKRYIQEQEGKDVFEYDIYNCPEKLKGQLRIGDFVGN